MALPKEEVRAAPELYYARLALLGSRRLRLQSRQTVGIDPAEGVVQDEFVAIIRHDPT